MALLADLKIKSVRHTKIGNTFGPPILPYNALGQGDPWVLLAANLYVSCQFERIHSLAPAVTTKPVIDDRTLKGPPDQVLAALLQLVEYDKTAGHEPEKITLSATTAKLRELIAKWVIGQISPPVILA